MPFVDWVQLIELNKLTFSSFHQRVFRFYTSRCECPLVYNLGIRCCFMWAIALISWVSDRTMCNLWEMIGFPYCHCIWHIFIFLASYVACVLFAYFDAKAEVPEQMPTLQYWPRHSWTFGIPYVSLKRGGSKPADRYL